MKYIDLHVHSTKSDGTFTPSEIILLAAQQQLSAIALTDHDTVSGIAKAHTAIKEHGIDMELVPGVELSTDYNGIEVHLLGYYIDTDNASFLQKLTLFQDSRTERNAKMIGKLQQEGFDISLAALRATFPDSILTRAHFARFLTEMGLVKNIETVFSNYLGDDCRCYVPREKITPFEAIDLIHAGNGLAFFAHPLLCHMNSDQLRYFVKSMAEHGLSGIEAIYSTHTPADERNMKRLAKDYGLLISGGSDFHGNNKPSIQLKSGKGNLAIPYQILEDIKAAIRL
ncbi:PHP domain-containing protein [Lachnospiraceae bacterium ZAX-1]